MIDSFYILVLAFSSQQGNIEENIVQFILIALFPLVLTRLRIDEISQFPDLLLSYIAQ